MNLMYVLQVVLLGVVQGLAELLPVSSSAHVIVAEKLMGLKPEEAPQTLLLVMLHTGTMFAVIVYFWPAWKRSLFASREVFTRQAIRLGIATALTAAVGVPLMKGIEKGMEKWGHVPHAQVEDLFGNLPLISVSLAAVGVLILIAGLVHRRAAGTREIGIRESAWIGAVQGLCLPFRGFSRSGATISTGLLLGAVKARVEEFSFALAVILTPAAIVKELWRLVKPHRAADALHLSWSLFAPSLLGMLCAFLAGLLALRWLSRWLEGGRWYLFGIYCLLAAAAVFALHCRGY
jgi:undecaprenyl-diphosphatase